LKGQKIDRSRLVNFAACGIVDVHVETTKLLKVGAYGKGSRDLVDVYLLN